MPFAEQKYESAVRARAELDRDFLCSICLQTMEAAFLTRCGHSFCFSCITTHLGNRNNCPSCGQYLTIDQLWPNILLTKVMKKVSLSKTIVNSSPAEQLRLTLEQGMNLPVEEMDSLLLLLGERKQELEQEEAETNMDILHGFLQRSLFRKQEKLRELQDDLQFLQDDIATVEKRQHRLLMLKDRHYKRLIMGSAYSKNYTGCASANTGSAESVWRGGQGGACTPPSDAMLYRAKRPSGRYLTDDSVIRDREKTSGSVGIARSVHSRGGTSSVHIFSKKRRVLAQFDELQEAYLTRRRQVAFKQLQKQLESSILEKDAYRDTDNYYDGLDDFQSVLTAYTRYSHIRVVAELHPDDLFRTAANVVSSIDFDRDDELFATAGVSRRIKVFKFETVVHNDANLHCPVVEIPARSNLSCVSWNKHNKPVIASSDFEGIVTVWDANRSQSVMEYEEHEKRAWSVDFSRSDPSMLVSGSDDGKVKVWRTNQETSALSIDMKVNICCVKFNPVSSCHIAVGSADRFVHYFDLRNPSNPLFVLKEHKKAVSYVNFLSSNELASASIDSTLRLWDVQTGCSIRTFRGHTNVKNFVGLTVNSEYIACGSETNEVVVYHKAMTQPCSHHKFWSPSDEESENDRSGHFISAVCWKRESPILLAANSRGTVKVLVLAP